MAVTAVFTVMLNIPEGVDEKEYIRQHNNELKMQARKDVSSFQPFFLVEDDDKPSVLFSITSKENVIF